MTKSLTLTKALGLCASLPLSLMAQEAIFDGKTLNGWSGNQDIWRVEEGAITAEIKDGDRLNKNEFLFFDEKLEDFELTLEYKITGGPTANSGIQFRSEKKDGSAVGYQADLDDGKEWLGRIYDEHGRKLILERGTLTKIGENGKRHVLPFTEASVLEKHAKKNDWNSYRILAKGHRVEIFINDIHFSTLEDFETGQYDLSGLIALQLHSGVGPAKLQFRNIQLEKLKSNAMKAVSNKSGEKETGVVPKDAPNIGFEKGDFSGWTVKGDFAEGQPVKTGALEKRMGQKSNADGGFWFGGYEVHKSDKPKGTLESKAFRVTHPWGGLRVGGGSEVRHLRVEVVDARTKKAIGSFVGNNKEPMTLQAVDLRKHKGKKIFVRILDQRDQGWGHINYDDFRFYNEKPSAASEMTSPLLWGLQQNANQKDKLETVREMVVPEGFEVNTVLAEPQVKQPISFTFDAKGRLWVAEAFSYPRRFEKGKGKDTLVIFEDTNGDGKFDKRKVFADNLELISGFEVGYGGVYVANSPEFLFIPDKNGDDKPDGDPIVLLDGFGTKDTHETPNSFLWGNDGWLYGCAGMYNPSWVGKPGTPKNQRVYMEAAVWRFHPVTEKFEIYANGGSNQWGLSYDADGEMFMTHCRSAWGLGPVTQVLRDGHYWSQANQNHKEFIATDRRGYRARKLPADNYLTSVAAYGHGEGGAGQSGSRSLFGGHSHVGTMVYLGDNWPDEYRGNLFTNNLHGSQMNREILHKVDSAYLSSSQGNDQLYSADPEYLAVHLKYGPDGAVYISDWADKQQCHNNRYDIWNRTNGRIYKMIWKDGYKPRNIDLSRASNLGLLKCLEQKNEWFSHMAQHLLAQRKAAGKNIKDVYEPLKKGLMDKENPYRYRYLVSLNAAGGITKELYQQLLADEDPVIVRQALVYLTENPASTTQDFGSQLLELAKTSSNPTVRLYLASSCQGRVAEPYAKQIVEALAMRSEDVDDRFVPKMIWYAYHKYAKENLSEALALAEKTPLTGLRRSIYWYALKQNADAAVAAALSLSSAEKLNDAIQAMSHSVLLEKDVKAPNDWEKLSLKAAAESPDSQKSLNELNTKFGLKAVDQKAVLLERKKAAKAVFMVCAACHAPGKDQPGPSLEEIAAVYDNKADIIKWVKTPGKKRDNYPNMPGFPHMTERDLELVAEYLLDVKKESKK